MSNRQGRFYATNHALAATFSGGDWSLTLPLDNLKTTRLASQPARSGSLDAADTQFDIDFGRVRKLSIVAALATNITSGAKYRLRLAQSDDFAAPEYDTGWVQAYPSLFVSTDLDWEDENWWTGQPLEDDIAAYNRNIFVQMEPAIQATHARFEFLDTSNPDLALDIGHLFASGGLQPEFNFNFGTPRGFRSRTLRDVTPSGRAVFDRRPLQRVARFDYDALSKGEAVLFQDAAARNDIEDPVLFVPDPDDEANLFREAFLARFERLPDRIPRASGNSIQLQFEEVIS
ncbi:hypothetical protein BN1012_Phect2590 [Candidatus Phaeomarinobacter ectocarpi]|uniref:Uncharacterized protein n=1 Tax=Candidatus Phaeomarinibacter ectocarpi TaxID=1458461 RepID=X5MAF3_9HYPH|nr:hypothetical protein [Candidatus Phaeomarinobacter ectocarpi]CDO60803.1 hypothetical protein BN1012_Phect2590 [Candidatus Phaeomarinobacter ectocarpi]